MHLVYVEFGYPHPHGGGGAGTYVQLVGWELVKRGHQVSVIADYCPKCGDEQNDLGVHVYRPKINSPLHWYLGRVPWIRQLALALRTLENGWHIARLINSIHRKQPINLIEYSDGGNVWMTIRHDIPYIVHLHGSRYTFLRKSSRPVSWGDWLERQLGLWCIRRADQVISPSQAILDDVKFETKERFPDAVVLPYPLDPRVLVPVNNTSSSTNGRSPLILFAARNDPVKGGDVLLQAVPLVRQRFPDVEFLFFGYQPDVMEEKVQGVKFYPFLPREELLKKYAAADICVVPSKWDNSPNTVYEAMAAAKPVIASRVGGIPELVVDHETGILVDPGSPTPLANAIIELLEDPERRCSMGKSARQQIQKIADLSNNLDRRIRIYSSVFNREQ